MTRLLLAVTLMAAFLYWGMGTESTWLAGSLQDRLLHLAWLVPAGAALYFASLYLLGLRASQFRRRA